MLYCDQTLVSQLLFCSILCYYEKRPEAALSRLFSAPFCLPVHCGQTRSTRVLKQLNEERQAVAGRRERLRELIGRQSNPSLQKSSNLNGIDEYTVQYTVCTSNFEQSVLIKIAINFN